MISLDDINNLARLSRLEIPEGDKPKLQKDMESIVGYFHELANVDISHLTYGERSLAWNENIMREDVVTNKIGEYTRDILNNAPRREGNFIAVKAIFGEK